MPVVPVPLAVEGGVPSVPFIEADKAWIDKNTKVVDARSYKPWSETLFKIHNKYNGNNIGRKIAPYFSQKDKDGYDAVQLGFGDKKEKNTTKPMLKHFEKSGAAPKAKLAEFRGMDNLNVGDVVRQLPGQPHQLEALTEGVVFEVSTEHFDSDSYRVWKGDTQ